MMYRALTGITGAGAERGDGRMGTKCGGALVAPTHLSRNVEQVGDGIFLVIPFRTSLYGGVVGGSP